MFYFNEEKFKCSCSQAQKQPFANAINNILLKLGNIYSKISVLESLFNKVLELQACNFIKKLLQHSCFPVNIGKFLRTKFFIEHLQWLVLQVPYNKSCSQKFYELHQNVSPSESFLIKIQALNLQLCQNRRCFAVNFCEISQSNIMRNNRLLLDYKWCCGK